MSVISFISHQKLENLLKQEDLTIFYLIDYVCAVTEWGENALCEKATTLRLLAFIVLCLCGHECQQTQH